MSAENEPRTLVVLSCSGTKVDAPGLMPATHRYDGPFYKVLRKRLRESSWPAELSVGVLSARYGLIGALTQIENYDERMSPTRALELRDKSTTTLAEWAKSHNRVRLVLGRDYLPALDLTMLEARGVDISNAEGPIGMKLKALKTDLGALPERARRSAPVRQSRPLYFLPDWDDVLDADFDFRSDAFSAPTRGERNEVHCVQMMRPKRICDGVLVSLAQHTTSKGTLRRFQPTAPASLAPPLWRGFGLNDNQFVFGDCGAFTYVNEEAPTISVEQACAMYELYEFDFGASVDHIPVPAVKAGTGKRFLSKAERRQRVDLTIRNAQRFLDVHRRSRASFTPVGTVQGLNPKDYADNVLKYLGFGYQHLALGGLVPLSDAAVLEVVQAVNEATSGLPIRPWIHLFGVFRPKLQERLSVLGVSSFDSATYFRKAWLRSGQNYLATDGQWYTAIRVPMTKDGRTRKRLLASGKNLARLKALEGRALDALHDYDAGKAAVDEVLAAVLEYDGSLARGAYSQHSLAAAYRRTLEDRPWQTCDCPACSQLGIDVVIFRGYNRNKRRGSHNTLMLYRGIGQGVA